MSRTQEQLGEVNLLGNKNTKYEFEYSPEVLQAFVNKHPDNDYVVTFDGYEGTSLCPVTHQPDFFKAVISYIPRERMVESKSLKLYLFSFRNHPDFHEDCANMIMKDLVKLMDPKYLEVRLIYSPRGGISIFPFCNYADPSGKYDELAKQRKLDVLRDASNRSVKFDA